MRVGIIGAGIAGLSAGYSLTKQGIHPIIFEKDSFSGGRLSSDRVDNFIIDRGAYTIPDSHYNFLKLIQELDLSGDLQETSGTASTFSGRSEYKIKVNSPKDFLLYKLLGFKDKKDLIKLFIYATSLGKKLNLHEPTKKTLELEKEKVSDYLIKNYSIELLEKIAYPIFADLFLGVPEDNSTAVFLSALRNLTHFKIYTLNRGMGEVVKKLDEKLGVKNATTVSMVHKNEKTNTFHVKVAGDPTVYVFDKIIFAVPLPLVPDLYKNLPESLGTALKKVKYTPSMVLAMGLKAPFINHSFMNTFLRKEISTLATLVLDHYKGHQRIPRGKGLATAILTKNASKTLFNKTKAEITNTVLKEMDALWNGFSSNLLFTRVYRWPFGGVQLPPGALAQHASMREDLNRMDQAIAFIGDGLYRASIEVSLQTGYSAAKRIMASP